MNLDDLLDLVEVQHAPVRPGISARVCGSCVGRPPYPCLVATLARLVRRRTAALAVELERQWEEAHFDHCGRWPHSEGQPCHWPRPDVLNSRVALAAIGTGREEVGDEPRTDGR
jgi:hypothetical protein